jgi:hypothetical protein
LSCLSGAVHCPEERKPLQRKGKCILFSLLMKFKI